MNKEQITSLDDFIRSDYFETYKESIYSNMPINDPERFNRVYDAASEGSEGSTHAEVINDWREALNDSDLSEETKEAIEKEVDSCEQWHEKNGSLHRQGA